MSSSEQQFSTTASDNQDVFGNRKERKFKDLKPKLLYNAILVGILFSFGIFGAIVFKKFEAASVASVGFEENDSSSLPSTRELLQDILNDKNLINQGVASEQSWQNSAAEKLESFIKSRIETAQVQEPVQWGFADSWLFACTIFTTIGYGNIAPLSIKGRIFCMLFAAVGIPLFSVVAGSLASLITDIIHTCHAEYHRRKRQAKATQQKKDDSTSSPQLDEIPELELTLKHISLACLGYLCLGALFFSLGEGWSMFEAFYYCFITLSTVGLGDYVPGHVHHTFLFGMYILVGLVLVIMLFGALEDVISKRCQKLKDKLKVID